MNLLYLTGPPASGKSTVFAKLTDGLEGAAIKDGETGVMFTRWQSPNSLDQIIELGYRRAEFSGTDTLPMNAVTAVELFLDRRRPPLVIAEGDRLANERFFNHVIGLGYELWLFTLKTPSLNLEDRRLERELAGHKQNHTWIKGRETALRNLHAKFLAHELPGNVRPDWVVSDMLQVATPFQAAFQREVVA